MINKNNINNNNNDIVELQNENEQLTNLNNELNSKINEIKFENGSLKDKCSEVQSKNKELKDQINELQNKLENNKNEYLQDINKLQKDILDFKQKELQEKNNLDNEVKRLLYENNDLKDKILKLNNEIKSLKEKEHSNLSKNTTNINNSNLQNNNLNDRKIVELQKQIQELIQYKNKCGMLEKNIFQFKTDLRRMKQEKDMLTISLNNMNKNNNNNLDKINKKENIQICNKEIITYESKNIKPSNNNINISSKKLEEIEKEKEMLNNKNKKLFQNINVLQKKYDDLTKEKNNLATKKNELIKQVNDLNDLVDLSNKDLVAKNLELKKVIEVLHKQIELESNKKNELENKLLKLQQKVNKQIDEASEREEGSINTISKISKENNINNNLYEKESVPFSFNESEVNENYKNQILALKNENNSLMKIINNLKNEIKLYKSKLRMPSSKAIDEKAMQNIQDINDENLIKDITEEMNKWKQEYYKLSKINDLLKEKISKLEKNLGVEEEIQSLKDILSKKDELLMNLTLQIKEYQSKSDDIILGRSNKSKDRQIEILLNEVKGIRKRLLNMVTLNERITDFEEFMSNIKIIQEVENKVKDKNLKKAFEQLNFLIEEYKLSNDMAYNDFLVKLFMIE